MADGTQKYGTCAARGCKNPVVPGVPLCQKHRAAPKARAKRTNFKTCEIPECPNEVRTRKLCAEHLPKGPGYDLTCEICGAGPFASLVGHIKVHGVRSREYKRRFNVESLISDNVQWLMREHFLERVDEGLISYPPRKKICDRGHRLSGDNLMIRTSRGQTARQCRKCKQENDRERKRRASPHLDEPRLCDWCDEEFMPLKGDHRFCSSICARRWDYAQTRVEYPERACAGCGERFIPKGPEHKHLYCSPRCRVLFLRSQRYEEQRCPGCDESFIPSRVSHQFCSKKCSDKVRHAAKARSST